MSPVVLLLTIDVAVVSLDRLMRHPPADYKPRRGAIVVQLSLCLTVLRGVVAITRDGGRLLAE